MIDDCLCERTSRRVGWAVIEVLIVCLLYAERLGDEGNGDAFSIPVASRDTRLDRRGAKRGIIP